MELKVWVEGIQRIVCGVTEKTTCQDVVYALAHATGKTGRFTLIERWRNNERLLAPQEHPLKVLNKWGEYSQDVQFILQRSALDGLKNSASTPNGAPMVPGGPLMSPQLQGSNFGGVPVPPSATQPSQVRHTGGVMAKAQSAEPAAVWKPPPPHGSITGIPGTLTASSSSSAIRGAQHINNQPHPPVSGATGGGIVHRNNRMSNPQPGMAGQAGKYLNDISGANVPNGVPTLVGSSRLSPDSGRGSDKTGSDTSNSYNDKDNLQRTMAGNAPVSTSVVKSANTKQSSGVNMGQVPQVTNPSIPSQNPAYHMANGLPPTSYGGIQRSASATQMAWNRSGTPINPNMYHPENNQQLYHLNNVPNGSSSGTVNQNHIISESPYGFAKQSSMPALVPGSQQYVQTNWSQHMNSKQQTMIFPTSVSSAQQMMPPPAYRPPPGPQQQQLNLQQSSTSYMNRNSSPADPPPYRDPPPPPGVRFRSTMPSSPTNMPGGRLQHHRPIQYQGHQPSPVPVGVTGQYSTQPVRPPHYSPPPTHRVAHLSRHPSKSSLVGGGSGNRADGGSGGPNDMRNRATNQEQRLNQYQTRTHSGQQAGSSVANMKNKQKVQSQQLQEMPQGHLADVNELLNLVTSQQSTLQSQQADIRQYEAEEVGFENSGIVSRNIPTSTTTHSTSKAELNQINGPDGGSLNDLNGPLLPGSQLELVLSEVSRLEEMSNRNDEELKFLNSERAQMDSQMMAQQISNNSSPLDVNDGPVDENIRGEILQLHQRLAGTDLELQRTNTTLRRLGDEMRNMSLEKTRQREQELVAEIERLQSEIKSLQRSSEDSANISQQLSKDVKDVEDQIRARKAEVEELIKEMREANMESLAISPPEESKQFLDGPPKPGQSRKMMGSPRQLENAVPTSRNPHGVWV